MASGEGCCARSRPRTERAVARRVCRGWVCVGGGAGASGVSNRATSFWMEPVGPAFGVWAWRGGAVRATVPWAVAASRAEGHISCTTCGQTVTFPRGAAMVRCPTCRDVLIIRRTGMSLGQVGSRGTRGLWRCSTLIFLVVVSFLGKPGMHMPPASVCGGACRRQGAAQPSHRLSHSLASPGAGTLCGRASLIVLFDWW